MGKGRRDCSEAAMGTSALRILLLVAFAVVLLLSLHRVQSLRHSGYQEAQAKQCGYVWSPEESLPPESMLKQWLPQHCWLPAAPPLHAACPGWVQLGHRSGITAGSSSRSCVPQLLLLPLPGCSRLSSRLHLKCTRSGAQP